MRMCQRLADLAMELAEAVVARAREEAKTPAADAPKARTPDAATLFTRLSAAALKAITLEAKLAGGSKNKAEAPAPKAAPEDPRRQIISQVLDLATVSNPDRGQLRRDIMRLVDKAIARDPEGKNEPFDIIQPIFNDHNLEMNYATMPDDLLDKICRDGIALEPANTL